MNTWHKQFEQHRLRQDLEAINKLIDAATLKTDDALVVSNYQRLVSVLKQFTAYVNGLDPNLTTTASLNTLAEPLPQLKNNLQAFLLSNNVSQLQAANSQADIIVQRFPAYATPVTGNALAAAAADFTKQAGNLILTLQEQAKDFATQVQQVVTAAKNSELKLVHQEGVIQAQASRLDNAISDFQKQFSDAEAARRKVVEQTEKQRTDQFNSFREQITNQVIDIVEKNENELTRVVFQFRERADEVISDLETKNQQAADLVQVTANITVTGNFDKLAADEKQNADRWRGIAVLCMCGLVALALIILTYSYLEAQFEWKMVLFRYATALILAFPAAYAMAESAHHRKLQQKYRQMQLELASIDPFIESLPLLEKQALKKTLAERMFAQPERAENEAAVSVRKVFRLAEKAVEGICKKA